ncbi:unnamed protein product [Rotaria socialis]
MGGFAKTWIFRANQIEMLHFEKPSLRVCAELLKERELQLYECRLILLIHLLTDAEELLELFSQTNIDIYFILGKPFSFNKEVLQNIKKKFKNVDIQPYDVYDKTDYIDRLLQNAYQQSSIDKKSIVIFEVGGYFHKALAHMPHHFTEYIKGVVEVTTFGHTKYIAEVENIPIPVYSIARSLIKSIEARYVGRAAVMAIDKIFREQGVSTAGRTALVIGFGMIGKSVADSLRSNNYIVSVFDTKSYAKLDAFTLGYKIGSKQELLRNADIIFSATAQQSLSYEEMMSCKDHAVLVSVGSRGGEFDVQGLVTHAINEPRLCGQYITKYKLNNGKTIVLIRNGEAVNFVIQSCPDEIVDMIHAEMLICGEMILRNQGRIGIINEASETDLNRIARLWLKNI